MRKTIQPFIELCEQRRLFAFPAEGAASIEDDILYVNGRSSADTITIVQKSSGVTVTINGKNFSFDASDYNRINVNGDSGNDRITAGGVESDMYVNTGYGDDYVLGGKGNDVLTGADGNDNIVGGAGKNQLFGSGGDDRLSGSNGPDLIKGEAGNDRIYAGAGADTVTGGAGDDRIHATAKDDLVDTIDCGDGADVAWIRAGDTTVNCETVHTVAVTDALEK